MDAGLADRLSVCDATCISVKLLSLDDSIFKLRCLDWQVQLAGPGFDANTPAIGALVEHHTTGVIAQTAQLLSQCCHHLRSQIIQCPVVVDDMIKAVVIQPTFAGVAGGTLYACATYKP